MTAAATDATAGSPIGAERPGGRRFIDRGAIFAGWVGLGVGLVIAIALELILAVQPLVFVVAPLAGALVGAYANVRSERWRPRGRVLLNAGYASLVTAVGLAVLYVALRLLFVFADSGARPNGTQIACQPGPDCAYRRYVELGQGDELAAFGITDAASFEAAVLREQASGALALVIVTSVGGLAAGAVRALRTPPAPERASAA